MTEPTHIDEKIKQRALRQTELADLGEEIASSAKLTVVAFIDLVESTSMKESQKPDEWLGAIYEFLVRVSSLVTSSGGSVVKRIGDEILATFPAIEQSEEFLRKAGQDVLLNKFSYKVAVDFGQAYFFRFEGRQDDPYGTVVDRCARIAKLGIADSILCSTDYALHSDCKYKYGFLGSFSLRGLRDDCALYSRPLKDNDSKTYLKPLLDILNSTSSSLEGFKQVGRTFESKHLNTFSSRHARPFLARELVSLPMCPYSAVDFYQVRENALRRSDFDDFFRGYVVEWDVYFSNYRLDDDSIILTANVDPEVRADCFVSMTLTKSSLEILKLLTPKHKLLVRGVLERIFLNMACLNYVDFKIPST